MIYSDFKGNSLSRLGFGAMRLPVDGNGKVDESLVKSMIRFAFDHGVNYFDTALPYHGGQSEAVLGNILKDYPRDRFYLADKYPGHQLSQSYNPAQVFEHQLRICQVDYFDFYLLHNVCESSLDVYTDPRWGIIPYFIEQRKRGRIRHLGFSSHAEPQTLAAFLDSYPDVFEFCQIQLNYVDWTLQKAKEKCDILSHRNIPIWVMEPVRGGKLATMEPVFEAQLHALRPEESTAAWAFRWLQQQPGIKVILSGMSNVEQVVDNVKTFTSERPLNHQEEILLQEIAKSLQHLVPCTGCRYCCEGCPMGLDIPLMMATLNDARFQPSFTPGMRMEFLPEGKQPSACIGCGACARICPQHIPIPEAMQELTEILKKIPNWTELSRQREAIAKKSFAE